MTGEEGFRTRVICKSVVVLQWGKQRLLTKEAGTSAHIDAVKSGKLSRYGKDYDGFVELSTLFQEACPESYQSGPPSPQRSISNMFGFLTQSDSVGENNVARTH